MAFAKALQHRRIRKQASPLADAPALSNRVLPVSMLGLATAVPPNMVEQTEVMRRAPEVFAATLARHPGLIEVFVNTGIERRFTACSTEWYEQRHDWPERNAAYIEAASALFIAVARGALTNAALEAGEIDTVVTVSSTGIATPSLEARVAQQLGFSAKAARVPVFGLGCAGGVTGLSLAANLARAQPGQRVLFVGLELCTLALRYDRIDKADLIAAALFGDGAAAAVLQVADGSGSLARIGAGFEHLWPDTLDIMGWSVDPAGLGVILSPHLPAFVAEGMGVCAREFLAATEQKNPPPRFVCHPGGTKVLNAVEQALSIPAGSLEIERSVLRDFGNMSAPTVLFVLERALAAGLSGPAALAALGPGFTASFLALEAGHG